MRQEVRSDVWVGVAAGGREGVGAVGGVGGQRFTHRVLPEYRMSGR